MNLVVLTGAGISAESGLATFRAEDGLWAGHKIEDVCTPEAFARDPGHVCQFYDVRKLLAAAAEPNAAHLALADLEHLWQKHARGDFLLITQNVDDLHERAGSRNLIHMHGELNSAYCTDCGYQGPRFGPLDDDRECPSCEREMLRPDIVFFGEIPRGLPKIDEALKACDVFVAIGTSGQVYPAAGFVQVAKSHGAQTVLLNLDLPAGGSDFDFCHAGHATVVVPRWTVEIANQEY
jgi:NAD-dependent deacetylase